MVVGGGGCIIFCPCLSACPSLVPVKMCNQVLQQFSSNQFETMHNGYKHIEDVHVTFHRRNFLQNYGIFDKITAFLTWIILRLGLNIG